MKLQPATLATKRPQQTHTDLFGHLMVPASLPKRFCDNCQRCGGIHSTRSEYLDCRAEYAN